MYTNNTNSRYFSIDFHGDIMEFVDTVKFYLDVDAKLRSKIAAIFRSRRDWDLCRIEDSLGCLQFKRDVFAIILWDYHRYAQSYMHCDAIAPWEVDTHAMNCATRIRNFIDEVWNYGE